MPVVTLIDPAPTRETTIEVEVEDDWTKTVANTPTMRPAIGLDRAEKSSPPAQLPRTLNEVPMRSRKNRKQSVCGYVIAFGRWVGRWVGE